MYSIKTILIIFIIAINSWYVYIPLRIKKNYTRTIEINNYHPGGTDCGIC